MKSKTFLLEKKPMYKFKKMLSKTASRGHVGVGATQHIFLRKTHFEFQIFDQ